MKATDTFGPALRAISSVSSVDPSSTNTISSTHGRRCARNPPRSRCSFRQIATTPNVGEFLLLISASRSEDLNS